MGTNEAHAVFVYGTLRQHSQNPQVFFLPGYEMYATKHFPFIIQREGSVVRGQILEVDDDELTYLDRYEGLSKGLYTREKALIYPDLTRHAVGREVWVYVAGPALTYPKIESGDWYAYRSSEV